MILCRGLIIATNEESVAEDGARPVLSSGYSLAAALPLGYLLKVKNPNSSLFNMYSLFRNQYERKSAKNSLFDRLYDGGFGICNASVTEREIDRFGTTQY